MNNKPDSEIVFEIWETAEDKKLPIGILKKKYIAFARDQFISNPPKSVLNKSTGWNIELSNRVINEWWSKSRTRERVLAIQLLEKMIENAKIIYTVEDNKQTPGIENVSFFESFCKINGKPFKISIIVKKMFYKNRYFAHYYAATSLL